MQVKGTRMFVPTLWDRLLDDEPHRSVEAVERQWCSLEEYKASIVSDLESLVNTRRELLASQLSGYPLLHGSLLEFGLPDFLGRGLHSSEDRQLIQRQLEHAIESNDCRFRNVRVRLLDQDNQDRLLRFRVDALLVLVDASQQVAFDAVLQAETQSYKVQNLT
uniref:type VI secretion system baseplate subunit TssE n=1 Tax=Halomonas sp. TaxID=1486246 RepID=UPI0026337A5D|nr:type VI secretion system baseplate subunit TssE [Halomonas sp.]